MMNFFAIAAVAASPRPPRQSEVQAQVYRAAALNARLASAAATPRLLELLAPSGAVRMALGSCCPSLDSLSAAALATVLRAEVSAAEITHSFHHDNDRVDWENDVSVATLRNATYFYNLNELSYLGLANNASAGIPATAETILMGFPPFTGGNASHPAPASFAEASQRPVYALLNLLAVDDANAGFGDVSVVFRNSWVRNATLFFPSDTGNWAAFNTSDRAPGHCSFPISMNLSAWPSRAPGVSNHLDHILVGVEDVFGGTNRCADPAFASPIANVLRRLFGAGGAAATKLSAHAVFAFIEADIAAAPFLSPPSARGGGGKRAPNAVKVVVGGFALFGTAAGDALRALARQQGWPLLWALGANSAAQGNDSLPVTMPSARLIDAGVCAAPELAMQTNLTALCTGPAADVLVAAWNVAAVVAAADRTPPLLAHWWRSLTAGSASLVVSGPLRPGHCTDAERCFGATAGGACACAAA